MLKQTFIFIWEILKIALIAFVIVAPIRYFLFQPFIVKGASMEPNFHTGDYLIIDEITYRFRAPERGEVIVFNFPYNPSQRYIKRVVGLPGETIKIDEGKVYITPHNGKSFLLDESPYLHNVLTPGNLTITLKKDEYFVMGDNRPFSSDSRSWGVLPKKFIIGRVLFRAWPLRALAEFNPPRYNLSQ